MENAPRCLLSPSRCHLWCLPSDWMTSLGIWDVMNCNMLSCFLGRAQCQMSPLPECVSSHWTSGWMPMCSMRQGDNAFYPCRVNAPGCWLSASAAAQRSVRCALLKLQLKQGLQTSVTSPNFTTGLPNPLPSVGKLTPGIKKDQSSWTHPASSLCLTKALMVPATERNTGLDISLGVWTSTVENICVLFWKSKLMFTKQDQKIPCFYAERKQNTWNWAVL